MIQTLYWQGRQQFAFDLVTDHKFRDTQNEQLLLLVIRTVSTGKSFLINSVRYLFHRHNLADGLKITVPTGIAAANISGSTIYLLLSLLNDTLTGRHLYDLQTLMKDVRLLVIDKYSFINVNCSTVWTNTFGQFSLINLDRSAGALRSSP